MKTKLIFIFVFCFSIISYAQIDLKINPIGLLFGSPDLSADFALSDKFSVEGGVGANLGKFKIDDVEYKRSGFSVFAAGRTYFKPEAGADKFGIGIYSRFRNINNRVEANSNNNFTRKRFAVGLLFGWKWVSDSNIIFELDMGAGRAFVNNIDFADADRSTINIDDIPGLDIDILFRLAVGYRLNGQGNR